MAIKILAQREVDEDHVSSVTNEQGYILKQPNVVNQTGGLEPVLHGTPNAAMSTADYTATIFKGGYLPYTKTAANVPNWYLTGNGWAAWGRTPVSSTGRLANQIVSDANDWYVSAHIVTVDTDDDGLPDKAVMLAENGGNLYCYTTANFTAPGNPTSPNPTWTQTATISTTAATNGNFDLCVRQSDNRLFAVYEVSGVTNQFYCIYSDDGGTTWTGGTYFNIFTSASETIAGTEAVGLICSSAHRLCVVYQTSSNYAVVQCSDDGELWTSGQRFDNVSGVGYVQPMIVEDVSAGYFLLAAKGAATGYQFALAYNADPSDGILYAVTENADTTNFVTADTRLTSFYHSDGYIYHFVINSSEINQYRTHKTKGAVRQVDLYDDSNITSSGTATHDRRCAVGFVAGEVWFAAPDSSSGIDQYYSCIFTNSKSLGVNILTIDDRPQFIGRGDVWITVKGDNAYTGDNWTFETTKALYGGERAIFGTPGRPTRATGDNANWSLVFDMGANNVLEVDTIAIEANVETLNFDMDDAATFDSGGGGAPQSSTTISFVETTLAGATWGTDGTIYKASAGMVPRKYVGWKVKAATTGTVYEIDDNTAERLHVRGTNLSALTGEDAKILSPRAWATQTAARRRYLRIYIGAQQTSEDYYEIKSATFGISLTLGTQHRVRYRPIAIGQRGRAPGGYLWRHRGGAEKENLLVTLTKPSAAEYNRLRAEFEYLDHGFRPVVVIPDDSNTTAFRLTAPPSTYDWNARQLQLLFEEI